MTERERLTLNEFQARNNAAADFKSFVQYTKPDYDMTAYHLALCTVMQMFADGLIPRLMLFAPPQTGKSEIVSRRLPAYLLGKNPNLKVVGASYSADLSNTFNRDVQRIVDTPAYANVFPDTRLNGTNVRTSSQGSYLRNADIFEIVGHTGFYKSVGVGGSLTGTPADVAIIDDPVKDAVEAYSSTFRERNWQWYLSVLSTRLHNESRVLLTNTRWHHDDLAGRILEAEGDKWQVLSFPAIKENDHSNPYDKRETGTALYPQRHSLERMLERKKVSERIFTSLYQQRPSAEDGGIWQKWFTIIPDNAFPAPGQLTSYGTDWDTAYSEADHNTNAATAYVTAGVADGKMYIDAIGWIMAGFPTMIEFMHAKPAPHFIEAKASGASAKQTLNRMGIAAIEVQVQGGDKVSRAELSSVYAQAGLVCIRESIAEKMYYDSDQGILKFPNGKKQDLADALAQSMQRLMKRKTKELWAY